MSGHLHPITVVTERITRYLKQYGFQVVTGPEIETDEYNFLKLNIDQYHPARGEHDTFYLEDGKLLRTHTSPMQIRYAQQHQPPYRILVPGRTFRNEATDATHQHTFHQIEGLVIDPEASLSSLIVTLEGLLNHLFNRQLEFRLRVGYFPFVEPALELDIKSGSGYLEVLGAGMVHPKVLKNMGLDSDKTVGFAFGIGLERLINLIYGVDDVRHHLSADYRFIGQFYDC